MTQSHCSPYPVIQIEWLQAVRKTNLDRTLSRPESCLFTRKNAAQNPGRSSPLEQRVGLSFASHLHRPGITTRVSHPRTWQAHAYLLGTVDTMTPPEALAWSRPARVKPRNAVGFLQTGSDNQAVRPVTDANQRNSMLELRLRELKL